MRRLLFIATFCAGVAALPAGAQIRGVPPSVTSMGPNGFTSCCPRFFGGHVAFGHDPRFHVFFGSPFFHHRHFFRPIFVPVPIYGGPSYPVVVKPVNQGSSVGVSIVHREEQLAEAVTEAGQYGPEVLVERFVQGRELTVGMLGEDPLPVVEIRPHQSFFDFTAKYTPGSTDYIVPATVTHRIATVVQDAARSAHRALGCRHLSRTDFILGWEKVPVILEVNTIPGFTPTSLLPKAAACLGMSYEVLCERLVLMAVEDAHVSSRQPALA